MSDCKRNEQLQPVKLAHDRKDGLTYHLITIFFENTATKNTNMEHVSNCENQNQTNLVAKTVLSQSCVFFISSVVVWTLACLDGHVGGCAAKERGHKGRDEGDSD